jgi:hypothetical protein
MSRRSRVLGFGGAGVLVVAGAVCAVAFAGGLGQILALVLIGLGLVAATSLVFLEVGFSEDRERAEAQDVRQAGGHHGDAPAGGQAGSEHGEAPASGQPGPPLPRSRPRLARLRGESRRLDR